MWITKVVLTLSFIVCLLTVFQTMMLEVGLNCSRGQITLTVYNVTDGIIISMIGFLQIQTFRASNALQSVSSLISVARGEMTITKLSVRITVMLYFFATPHAVVMNSVRYTIFDESVGNELFSFEFIYSMSIIFVYINYNLPMRYYS